ncbi:MAG: NAD(P)H-dependent oxidoreductase [Pseudomonadota bacterium]
MTAPLNILRVDSSARHEGSVSRELADIYIDRLAETRPVRVETRDVSQPLPVVTGEWIGANFTPEDDRSSEQKAILATSNTLVEELKRNDVIVLSVPIYNFNIPAALKLWVDQVARAGLTFRYTENGPVGLLEGKRAVILVASGGTPVGSEIDFATPYLKHVLGFLGIHEVDIVAADQLMASGEEKIEQTKDQVRALAA